MVSFEKLMTALNLFFQKKKKMQIPTCLHDLGCNFRGSNRLLEVTGPRSRIADLAQPLRFADDDMEVWWEQGAAKGREVPRLSLLSHSLTLAAKKS